MTNPPPDDRAAALAENLISSGFADRDGVATLADLRTRAITRAITAEDRVRTLTASLDDARAEANGLQLSLNEMHIRAVDAENAVRASVVDFLNAEAKRICDDEGLGERADGLFRVAHKIARGDDRNGTDDAAPVKPSAKITGRLVTVGRIATCDNYSETTYGENLDIDVVSGILIVMDDDNVRAAGGLFGKVIEVREAGQ